MKSSVVKTEMMARRRRGGLWRWLAVLVLLLVVGVVGVSVYVGWSLSHPEPRPVDRTPAELGLAFDTVEFPATDGVVLRGWFLPGAVPEAAGEGLDNEPAAETAAAADTHPAGGVAPGAGTIIFAHGFRSNRLHPSVPTLELAHALVSEGFNVLMFDFRNHGESGGNVTTLGYHEVKDVLGAVQWLRQERPAQAERIGIIGFSMGAVTSIIAASQEPAIGAVVADSPFSDLRSYLQVNMPFWTGLPNVPFTWTIIALLPPLIDLAVDQVSPVAVMPDIPQPILLIHTDGDTAVPVEESRRLAAAGNPDRTELWIVPGDRHVGARSADPAAYDQRIIEFFRESLGFVPSNM